MPRFQTLRKQESTGNLQESGYSAQITLFVLTWAFLDSHSVSDESNRNVKQEVLALYESEKLLPSSSFGGNPPKL